MMDLVDLSAYKQAKELTIDQLKKWLVKYKFKNYTVSVQQKLALAEEIAETTK